MEASALPRRGRLRVPIGKALLAPLGDEALVEQVRGGNERAFEVVYDRYAAGLLAFCRHMLGSRDEAEDALQLVFVSAHADLLRSERPIALKAWLYTIARNRCLSMLRSRREHRSDVVEPSTAGFADEIERRVELGALVADLRELPDEQRQALVLAEIGDLSHAEIGRVIGCEAVQVKSLIFQARSKLIEARKARETPCAEIRQQLATVRGGALRRGELRRHLKVCPGCAEFREEVRKQRAMLALLLPVVPSAALKRSVLAAAGISSGGTGVGGAGLVAGMAAKGGAVKLAIGCAVSALAVGGGIALHEEINRSAPSSTGAAPPPAAAPALQHRSPVLDPRHRFLDMHPAAPARPGHAQRPASTTHRGRHLAKGRAKHDAARRNAPAATTHGKARAIGHTGAGSRAPAARRLPAHKLHRSHPLVPLHRVAPVAAGDPALPVVPRAVPGRTLGTTA